MGAGRRKGVFCGADSGVAGGFEKAKPISGALIARNMSNGTRRVISVQVWRTAVSPTPHFRTYVVGFKEEEKSHKVEMRING
jgi:hypothetical protein